MSSTHASTPEPPLTMAVHHPDPDVLCLASWNADLVCRVPRPLARGETLMASGFEISPGGKGSNAAVAAARQGALVAVLARIGRDDFGRMGLDLWAAEGIDSRLVEQAEGERSGVAQILVYDDGDNSIAVAPGAGAGLGARQAQAAAERIRRARVVMAPNEVPSEATLAAFRIARGVAAAAEEADEAGETGADMPRPRGSEGTARPITLLNPAPARALPEGLLALCDVITPNETEARALAGLPDDAPVEAAAQALLARGCGAVVVTLGAAGCLLVRPGLPSLTVPGYRMAVVDTVGAGDTCTGALAAALARGLPLEDALRWANAAAALSVTGRGAIAGMPTLAATTRFLDSGSAG